MAAINSADEAAAWAHRNLPAKNTLTAADAKMVEERFQARLSAIGDAVSDGTSDVAGGCLMAQPDMSRLMLSRTKRGVRRGRRRVGRQKAATRAKKQSRRTQSVLWVNRFACAIRTTGSSCCGNPALCAAACRRIRITSPSHNLAHSDAA